MKDVYAIDKPKNPLPVIFDSPHSGRKYPEDFNYVCTTKDLKQCEDHLVDELFADVAEHNAIFLQALFPRSYIDTNRAADDIDPQLLDKPWENGKIKPTRRSSAGIGLIRRLINPGTPIYDRDLTQEEIQNRLTKYYIPYHQQLVDCLNDAHYNYGQVWHINCHSMPNSTAIPHNKTIGFIGNRGKPVDFVLGDRDGTTCDPAFTDALRDFIEGLDYSVSINDPFKGVELVGRYSAPPLGRHSLQLEINKALYMHEKTGRKSKNFDTLKADITKIIGFITDHAQSMLTDIAAD